VKSKWKKFFKKGDKDKFSEDSHPNGKANKIFADTIYNYLKNMGFPDSYHYDDS